MRSQTEDARWDKEKERLEAAVRAREVRGALDFFQQPTVRRRKQLTLMETQDMYPQLS